MSTIGIDTTVVAQFCRKHHIRRLSLFGSNARGDALPDSDVDLLVEFEEGHVPGFALVAIEDEMASILGKKVDLRTPSEISPRFRERVLGEAVPLYAS